MNKSLKIIVIGAVLLVMMRFFSFYSYSEVDDKTFYQNFTKEYGIYSLPHPPQLSFVGETVPLNDPQIKESYDKELLVNTYWQSQTVLFLKRSARYFPVIEPILKKHKIPEDFKYLAVIESGLTNVVSPAGATGFWQIMESTGKQYGLTITKEVDERYHLEKATRVACLYLKEAYQELGSWTLAAASYNMGISGVKRQLERQNAQNFYELTLNSETGRYLYRLMAVKQILENPKDYGFNVRPKDAYALVETYTEKVDSTIDSLGLWAHERDINYRILKYHNPWLRYHYLPVKEGDSYEITLPKKGFYQVLGRNDENGPTEPKNAKDQPEDKALDKKK
jgi:hypothetical protein